MKITFRSPVKAMLLLLVLLLTAAVSNAQCLLSKGDIVFTGYDLIDDQVNGSNPANGSNDRLSFVILRDVTANTEILFTDLGWTNQNQFQTTDRARTDGVIKWKTSVALPAGTEITINTKFSPSANVGTVTAVLQNYESLSLGLTPEYLSLAEISGDQIFAFTGSVAAPTLLAGMSINAPWTANLEYFDTNSGWSMLPTILSSGSQNLFISRTDPTDPDMRDAYTARLKSLGTISATAASVISTVNNPANWEISPAATPSQEFATLTNGNTFDLSLPVITAQPVDAVNVCPAGSTFFQVTADATACSYQWQIFNTTSLAWDNVPNSGIYGTTATTSRLVISNVTGLNGAKYRVRVYGTKPVISSEVSISYLPALTINTSSLPDGAIDVPYNQQLTQTGGKAAYSYAVNAGSTLPSGMTLSAAGVLGGSPIVSGTFSFTLKVTDGCNTVATKLLTLVITPKPMVNAVSVPADKIYKIGDNLDFTVNYDANVVVTGSPALGLTIGSSAQNAAYVSGSGTAALNFRYTVQAGDLDANGLALTGIVLGGGTIKSLGGSDANNGLANVGSTAAVNVDGVSPVISLVTSSLANGSYKDGTIVPIAVTFSENVVVTGTPQLTLETGSTDRTVNYVSGSGTSTLIFNYSVQTGDMSGDLDYVSTGALALSGATILDAAGNNAALTLAAPGAAGSLGAAKNLVIDAQSPVISFLSSVNADGNYKAGDVLGLRVTLNEAVTVTGTPVLSLNSGGAATYSFGSGNSVLAFTYTVGANQSSADLDYQDINSLSLAGGTIRDAAGNAANITLPAPGSANSLGGQKNLVIDALAPSIVTTDVPANGIYGTGQNLDLTINFNEAVTVNTGGGTPFIGITLNSGGTVQARYVSGSGTSALSFRYTVASGNMDNDGITLANSISLNGGIVNDAVGNNAIVSGITTPTAYVLVDGVAPTATVVVADVALSVGETSLATITFSEAVTGFTNADLTVANGTISAVSSSDGGITWTATFTPTAGISDATNLITLNNTGVQDAAGNAGSGTTSSNNYAIDNIRPTATIVIADAALSIGETSLVTITFSEAVTGFANTDLTIANGTLSAVASLDGGITWAATLTPSASISDASNLIALDNTGVLDAAGNAGNGTTNSNNYAIDTARPTASIVVADATLSIGETSLVTVTFSEAVTGFTTADLTAPNGTLSGLSSSDGGITWTATLTPSAGTTDASNVITLANTGVADIAGNSGSGTTSSNNYAIDNARPTATIVVSDASLITGETSLVTITFSEAVTGFSNADLSIANGTLSALSSSDGGITWTATLTPSAGVNDASNVITLNNTGLQDIAGNAGTGTTTSNNYAIDNSRPTATLVIADAALSIGETSVVTITFSEAVTGFTGADLTAANGTLSAVSSTDGGVTWTAIFTPTLNTTDATNLITLDNTGVQDAAGNAGSGTTNSNNYAIDNIRPTASIVIADAALSAGETTLVSITFSEAVSGFTNADLTVPNGTLSALTSADGGVTWTATFTPTAGITDGTNLIILSNSGVQDAAGNAGSGTTNSNNYAIDTDAPVLSSTVIASNNSNPALAKTGDVITVSLTASKAIATPTVAIAGQAATVAGSGSSYTATYTMNAADAEGPVPFNIAYSDLSGNNGLPVSATSNGSTVTFDRTAPASPLSLTPVAGNTQVVLNWTANTEADIKSYRIFGGTLTNPTTLLQTIAKTSNTFIHSALLNGTTYYYRISATDNAGNESNLTTDVSAVPVAPQTITFNALTAKAYGEADFDAGATASSALAVQYSSDNASVANISASGQIHITGPGTATITASQPGNAAFTAAPVQSQVLTVNKKNITLSLNAAPSISKVYDGNNTAALAAANYLLNGLETGDAVTVSGTATYDNKNAGTGKVVIASGFVLSGAQKDNYTLITGSAATTGSVTTKAAVLTAADRSKTYGDAVTFAGTEFTASGLINGDAVASVTLTSAGAAATATVTGSPYSIVPSAANGTGLGNYSLSYINGNLSVGRKALAVLNTDRSKVYGDILSNADFSGSIAGIRNSDNITLARSSTGSVATATTGSSYPIIATLTDPDGKLANYTVSNTDGILTVTPKALTITASARSKTYGDAVTFTGIEFSAAGLINGDAVTGVILNSAGAAATATVAGSAYSIVPSAATGTGLSNYSLIYTNGSLSVNRKVLVITADNQTRFAGTANPAFTLTYAGFVNGQNQSILSQLPTAGTIATPASPIGNYPITVSAVTASNYNITYQNGILKVVPGAPGSISLAAVALFENRPAGTSAGTLSSTSDDPNATFVYSLVSGAGDADNSLFSISGSALKTATSLDFEQKGIYSIRVRSTTQYGFSLDQVITLSISDVNEAPTLAAVGDIVICSTASAQQINLTGISAGPEGSLQSTSLTVSSSNPDLFADLTINNSGQLTYRLLEGKSGSAIISVTVKDNGGTANGGTDKFIRAFTLTVNPLPVIAISSDKGNSISKGETIRLTATGGSSYSWANASGIVSGQNSAVLTLRPAATATYRVTVTTSAGCVTEQDIRIEVKEDYRLVKGTNILSPNGDGVNDHFIIRNIDMYPNNTVKIFDRAGRLIYTKVNYSNEWDGTFQGAPLAEDTYFYVVDFGAGKLTIKGFITVVRE